MGKAGQFLLAWTKLDSSKILEGDKKRSHKKAEICVSGSTQDKPGKSTGKKMSSANVAGFILGSSSGN